MARVQSQNLKRDCVHVSLNSPQAIRGLAFNTSRTEVHGSFLGHEFNSPPNLLSKFDVLD